MTTSTLDLAVDATRAVSGAKQAEDALRSVGNTATRTQAQFQQSGAALSSAFAATGGAIGATQGIASAATAFQSLNIEAGAFAGARALLDIGRVGADFNNLSGAVSGSGGALSKLWLIMRANPLLTIATAISAAATAMALFGGSADETSDALRKQEQALDSLIEKNAELAERRRLFGGTDASQSVSGTQDAIFRLTQTEKLEPLDVDRIAKLFGVRSTDVRAGIPGGLDRPAQQFGPISSGGTLSLGSTYTRSEFTRNEALSFGGDLLRRRRQQENFDALNLNGAQLRLDEEALLRNRSDALEQQRFDRQRQAQEEAQARMDELIEKGREFGATIGDAFFNVASGAQTARQAIAGLISDLARAASQQAFAGIFGTLAPQFGSTTTQQAANVRVPSGEMAPG